MKYLLFFVATVIWSASLGWTQNSNSKIQDDGVDCNVSVLRNRKTVSMDNEKLYVYINWKAHLIRYEKTLDYVEKTMEHSNTFLKQRDIINATKEFDKVLSYLKQRNADVAALKKNDITDRLDELFYCYYSTSYEAYKTARDIIKQKKPFTTIATELKNHYDRFSSLDFTKRMHIKKEVERLDKKYNLSSVKVTKD